MNTSIEVEIYSYSAPLVMMERLHLRISPKTLDEMKDNGGGSFEILKSDPKVRAQPALLDYRNIVKFRLNDKIIGGFIIQNKDTVYVDEKEKLGERYKVSGEGLKCWFEDADVYPYNGLKPLSASDRNFSFASERGSWYKASDWVTPYRVVAQANTSVNPWKYAPAHWPDVPTAYWIWDRESRGNTPVGDVYFRYEFTTTSTAEYSVFAAGDDAYEIFVDAQLVSTTQGGSAYSEVNRVDFSLDAGDHILAFRVRNYGGAAGLLAALFKVGDAATNTPATLLTYTGHPSDSGWKVNGYPTQAPGWTPGEIIIKLLNEAQARGVLFPNNLTLTFSATQDSAGQSWGEVFPWSFTVGSSLATVVARLEEMACDVWIDPNTYQLYVWKSRGTTRNNANTPVQLMIGRNLVSAEEKGQADIKNFLLVETEDGWITATDSATNSASKYGRIEGSLSTNAAPDISRTLAKEVFKQKALPETAATFEIVPIDDAMPFVHFFVGDWVYAVGATGDKELRRIMSLSVTEDKAGNPVYALEFDTIFRDRLTKLENWLSRVSNSSSLGGGLSNGGTGGGGVIVRPPGQTTMRVPRPPTDVSGSADGSWNDDGAASVEAALNWTAPTSGTDNGSITVDFFEVWGKRQSNDPKDVFKNLTTVTTPQASIGGFQPAETWIFKVRARSLAGVWSDFSTEYPLPMAVSLAPMVPPSPPIASSKLGTATVRWSGLLGGAEPPVQFAYVYAVMGETAEGGYDRVGQSLRSAGEIVVTDLPVGATRWFKLIAVDRRGVATGASAAVSVVVEGIDIGDIGADIEAAIEEAKEIANAAQLSADGKNVITYHSDAPNVDGTRAGDTWFRRSGDIIIAQWQWDGAAWVSQTVGSTVIANLDAGKITTGFLNAARLQAGTIAVDKLIVTDSSNLIPYGDFESTEGFPWIIAPDDATYFERRSQATGVQSGIYFLRVAGSPGPTRSAVLNIRPVANAGEEYYLSFWARMGTSGGWNGTTSNSKVRVANQDGAQIKSLPFETAALTSGVWVKLEANFVCPAGVTSFSISIVNDATQGFVWLDDLVLKRKSGGELIVDGAITAAKIKTGTITANELAANSVTANALAAGSVTAVAVAANSITTNKLTIGDFTNLLDDPSFIENMPNGSWGSPNGATASINRYTDRAYASALRFLSNSLVISTSYNSNIIPCMPGDKFYAEVQRIVTSSGNSGGIGHIVKWRLADGTEAANTNRTDKTNGIISNVWTAPANAVSVQYGLSINADFVVGNNGYFINPTFRRMTEGSLIVDGAIDGKTITGALIRTAASGARVEMTNQGIRVLNSSNVEQVKLGYGIGTGMEIRNPATNALVPLSSIVFGTLYAAQPAGSPLVATNTTNASQTWSGSNTTITSPTSSAIIFITVKAYFSRDSWVGGEPYLQAYGNIRFYLVDPAGVEADKFVGWVSYQVKKAIFEPVSFMTQDIVTNLTVGKSYRVRMDLTNLFSNGDAGKHTATEAQLTLLPR